MTDPIAQAGLPHWTPDDGGWKLCDTDTAPDDWVGEGAQNVICPPDGQRPVYGHGQYWTRKVEGQRWRPVAYLAKPAPTPDLPTAIATCEAGGYGVVKRRTREEWEMRPGFILERLLLSDLNLIAPDPDLMREALIASGLSGDQLERSLAALKGVG